MYYVKIYYSTFFALFSFTTFCLITYFLNNWLILLAMLWAMFCGMFYISSTIVEAKQEAEYEAP